MYYCCGDDVVLKLVCVDGSDDDGAAITFGCIDVCDDGAAFTLGCTDVLRSN